MELTFEFDEFEIAEDRSVLCQVDLVMTEPPDPGTPASMNYPGDPPWPANFEIHAVRLIDVPIGESINDIVTTLTLSETEFSIFFSGGQDVVNNAYEWASEQEIEDAEKENSYR